METDMAVILSETDYYCLCPPCGTHHGFNFNTWQERDEKYARLRFYHDVMQYQNMFDELEIHSWFDRDWY